MHQGSVKLCVLWIIYAPHVSVVALFNAISKHQRTVVAATTSETAPVRSAKRQSAPEVALPRVSLLDMFHKDLATGDSNKNRAAIASATAAKPAAWSVLADDFVRFDTQGDGGQAAADLLDDDGSDVD